uniref:polysaccharide biosynthesis C-terminal domain-containing protein n=1 Tax=Vibrio vulnificus TaxID=672 RepID=UPI0013EEE0B8
IYKHNGAALSTVMAEFGILAFQLYIIKCKRLSVFHNLWNKIRKGLVSLILFFLSIYLLELCFHNENRFQYVTIVSMFSVIVYPLILFIVREPIFVRIIEGIKK